jgi:hypothetical protein
MSDKVFSRRDFLSLPDPKVEKRFVKELGKYVYFRQMTAEDFDSYDWSLVDVNSEQDGTQKISRNMQNAKAKYLVRCLCDEKGNRLFKDEEHTILGRKSPIIINALHSIAFEINQPDEIKNSNTEV